MNLVNGVRDRGFVQSVATIGTAPTATVPVILRPALAAVCFHADLCRIRSYLAMVRVRIA